MNIKIKIFIVMSHFSVSAVVLPLTFPGFMFVAVFCHRPKQIYRKLLKEKRNEKEKR